MGPMHTLNMIFFFGKILNMTFIMHTSDNWSHYYILFGKESVMHSVVKIQ